LGAAVLTATPQYLLAMKLLSFRAYGHDLEDIVRLRGGFAARPPITSSK